MNAGGVTPAPYQYSHFLLFVHALCKNMAAETRKKTNDTGSGLRYPFAAIVGQDDLKTCLILCAIDPSIGGVLIRGDKGTAKSTACRGLAQLMPNIEVRYDPKTKAFDPYNRSLSECGDEEEGNDSLTSNETTTTADYEVRSIPTPFVDLPIGATEDRVLGSLDFSATLQQGGKRVFAPGLLADANRGILYIDEVNLLPAHLVDVILDAAAMGVNTVHREGVTMVHSATFMLIGTMNPEEGDLRPQLLDRFGLMVDVLAPRDAAVRAEVVRQRISFERDKTSFTIKWEAEETLLSHQIEEAKERLAQIRDTMSDELLLLISRICTELKVGSLRADITLYKAATALTAWEGRLVVEPDDVRQAVPWVLNHRRRQRPFDGQSQTQEQNAQETEKLLDQIVNEHANIPPPETPDDNETEWTEDQDQEQQRQQQPKDYDHNNAGEEGDDGDRQDNNVQTFTASKPEQIKQLKLGKQQKGQPGAGRRNQITNTQKQRGHYVRSVPTDKPVDLALDATLRAAAANGLRVHPETGASLPIINPDNWRRKVRNSTTDTVILFAVDASGSMSARQRMEAVKGTVLALLNDAYQQRDRVGVIAFRGLRAEMILEPTRSVELAEKHLQRLPTGGRTPLAHALTLISETIHRITRHEPEQAMLLIVLSDGKANVPLPDSDSASGDPWAQTEQVAKALASLSIPTLVLDTEAGHVRIGRGRELADSLKADYLRLGDLSADGLVHTIRQAVG